MCKHCAWKCQDGSARYDTQCPECLLILSFDKSCPQPVLACDARSFQVPLSPSQGPEQATACCWHLRVRCLPWAMLVLAILVFPALLGSRSEAEGRAGQPFPAVTHHRYRKTEEHYSAWQQLIDECLPRLHFFQASKIAVCLPSLCVCACMPWCMQISFPKAPCPYWVGFGGVPLHKYWKSPVELFYFIFGHC